MPFTEGVAECEECGNWLNDDDECEDSECKLSPFYVGQLDGEDEEETFINNPIAPGEAIADFAECIDCGRPGCQGQCS